MKKKYKVGITFGAFDPLHFGHIKLFERAKKQCARLIVCVSDSEDIMRRKGHSQRFNLKERWGAVEAIKYVDCVTYQDRKQTKGRLVKIFKPDVIFVGSDHVGNFEGEGLGVPVVYLPHTDGVSSTELTKNK
jgi:glycerol-3-phosphate cytidylyltransferase